MIDDIIISEADFSNDALSCQISERPPTEFFSFTNFLKPLQLNNSMQLSSEDFFFDKLYNSPTNSKNCQRFNEKKNSHQKHQTKKNCGRLAWGLFEEDEESTVEMSDVENFEFQKKKVECHRKSIITSEFLLEEEQKIEEAFELSQERFFKNHL